MLYGRGAECAVVDGLLARARRTEGGGALIVSAEPAMGKTALLEYPAAAAGDRAGAAGEERQPARRRRPHHRPRADRAAPRTSYRTGRYARRMAAISHLPTPVPDAIRRRIFGLPAPGGRIA